MKVTKNSFKCRFHERGCVVKTSRRKRNIHEMSCSYRPPTSGSTQADVDSFTDNAFFEQDDFQNSLHSLEINGEGLNTSTALGDKEAKIDKIQEEEEELEAELRSDEEDACSTMAVFSTKEGIKTITSEKEFSDLLGLISTFLNDLNKNILEKLLNYYRGDPMGTERTNSNSQPLVSTPPAIPCRVPKLQEKANSKSELRNAQKRLWSLISHHSSVVISSAARAEMENKRIEAHFVYRPIKEVLFSFFFDWVFLEQGLLQRKPMPQTNIYGSYGQSLHFSTIYNYFQQKHGEDTLIIPLLLWIDGVRVKNASSLNVLSFTCLTLNQTQRYGIRGTKIWAFTDIDCALEGDPNPTDACILKEAVFANQLQIIIQDLYQLTNEGIQISKWKVVPVIVAVTADIMAITKIIPSKHCAVCNSPNAVYPDQVQKAGEIVTNSLSEKAEGNRKNIKSCFDFFSLPFPIEVMSDPLHSFNLGIVKRFLDVIYNNCSKALLERLKQFRDYPKVLRDSAHAQGALGVDFSKSLLLLPIVLVGIDLNDSLLYQICEDLVETLSIVSSEVISEDELSKYEVVLSRLRVELPKMFGVLETVHSLLVHVLDTERIRKTGLPRYFSTSLFEKSLTPIKHMEQRSSNNQREWRKHLLRRNGIAEFILPLKETTADTFNGDPTTTPRYKGICSVKFSFGKIVSVVVGYIDENRRNARTPTRELRLEIYPKRNNSSFDIITFQKRLGYITSFKSTQELVEDEFYPINFVQIVVKRLVFDRKKIEDLGSKTQVPNPSVWKLVNMDAANEIIEVPLELLKGGNCLVRDEINELDWVCSTRMSHFLTEEGVSELVIPDSRFISWSPEEFVNTE